MRIVAAILQDEEEKVVVEESVNLKGIHDDVSKIGGEKSSNDSFESVMENGVIKLEQSINILLTVSNFYFHL